MHVYKTSRLHLLGAFPKRSSRADALERTQILRSCGEAADQANLLLGFWDCVKAQYSKSLGHRLLQATPASPGKSMGLMGTPVSAELA